MATIIPIAYNTGSTISGTEQIGDLAIGTTAQDYSTNIGGVKWWASPDLDLQYIIGYVDLSGTHPNPISFVPCHIGFWGSGDLTENSFINLCNFQFNQSFSTGNDAKVWLNSNGYWTNFAMGVTPLPTSTPTLTPAPTSTPTPEPTSTPTPEPTSTPTPTPTSVIGDNLLQENGDDLLQENGNNILLDLVGYPFNLVELPYTFPSSGNTIINNIGGINTGDTNPNVFDDGSRGLYWNDIDSDGVDRSSYFSQFTGQSITITMTQGSSTVIYSGDTNSLKYWVSSSPTNTGFVFGKGVGVPPSNTPSGDTVLIQSGTTWTIGQPVYISVTINV